jgi:hypothetical protein
MPTLVVAAMLVVLFVAQGSETSPVLIGTFGATQITQVAFLVLLVVPVFGVRLLLDCLPSAKETDEVGDDVPLTADTELTDVVEGGKEAAASAEK